MRRVETLARALVPGMLAALTMAVAAGPTGVPALVAAVALPQVVVWSAMRPSAMSPPAAFLLGLLLDLLTLAPLGTGALTLLLAHGLAVAWRGVIVRRGFATAWFVFCGFAIGAAALGWALTAVLSFSLPPVAPALHQAVLTAALYPLFAPALGGLHAMMARAEDQA